MSYANMITLIGDIVNAPIISKQKDGSEFATFSILTIKKWVCSQSKEVQTRRDYHKIHAEKAALVGLMKNYIPVNAHVFLTGELRYSLVDDGRGGTREVAEVLLHRISPLNRYVTGGPDAAAIANEEVQQSL